MGLFDGTEAETQITDSHRLLSRVVQEHSPAAWVPLLSGGHDSICACHIASLHPAAPRPFRVYHIDTGIGAQRTRDYVKARCEQFGWELEVLKSPNREKDSYESFVREKGFPGPGMHTWAYARLKERSIQKLSTDLAIGQRPVMFISGCRRRESQRRMGYAVAVRRGDGLYKDSGNLRNPSRLWVAPCLEWMPPNQTVHMEEFGIPRNPLKDLIGLSGECFCGANAGEDATTDRIESERALIRKHAPDVEAEICRLEAIAAELGKPCKWGHKPPADTSNEDQLELPFCSMDLCIGCQR